MAEIKWTDSQLAAITHRGGSMIVSAAAGSGKTTVLVERIIRLMEKTDIDQMLVVTFTNAAAANMKQSIHKAILKKLQNPASSEESAHYARQLSLLNNASITTLHAFCAKFVREHFDALGLSPSIKLGDQTQLELMLKEAIEQSIEEGYSEQDEDFVRFAAQTVAKTNDGLLSDILQRLYAFLMSLPNPEKWLEQVVSIYDTQNAEALLNAPALTREFKNKCAALMLYAKNNLKAVSETAEYAYAAECMEQDLAFAEALSAVCTDVPKLSDVLETEKPKVFRLAKKGVAPEISDALKEMRAPYKAVLKEISDDLQTFNPDAVREFLGLQAVQMRAIRDRLLRIIEIYTAAKREKELLDFNDLEHLTLHLLYDGEALTPLAKSAAEEFETVVVDEYQDTNLVQEAILTALSKNQTNLFMVGDMKQSIYGFRNTAPELFSGKVQNYSAGKGGECVYLSENFRSRNCVLSFANLLFKQLMSLDAGGAPYTETEALHGCGTFPETDEKTEVFVLADERFQKNETEAEALFCAKKITELIESGFQVTDKSGDLRPVSYGDIVILTRSAKHIAAVFSSVFAACGIPVYCDDYGETFLESMEIQSLIAFLRAMDNPLQDIFLLSAFTSPLFGEPDADLIVRARLLDRSAPLYTCFQKFPETEEGYPKIRAFLDFIEHWRKQAQNLSVPDLLTAFLAETGFSEYMEALSGGEQRLANIRHFQFLAAQNFPGSETGGLYAFLNYLEKHRDFKSGLTSPKILPENTQMVQISTIHKSKGLEYPVVILAGTGNALTGKDNQTPVLFHRDIGIGLTYRNVPENCKILSPVRELIQKAKRTEELSEELRILYVALTRAKDRLIITGFAKDEERLSEYAGKASHTPPEEIPLSPSLILSGKSYLEWILLALQRKEALPIKSPVELTFVRKIEAFEAAEQKEISLSPKTPSPELRARLEYQYPHLAHTKLYSKISVTELKRIAEEAEEDAYKPFWQHSQTVSLQNTSAALQKGTLTHFVLEKIDFSETNAENTVQRLTEQGQLLPEESKMVDVSSLNRFLGTPLCAELKQADWTEKEFSFNVHIDGSLLSPESGGAAVQLQGTIDLLACMGGTLYVIDFKTDHITPENRASKIASYSRQIAYYKLGAQKLFPKMQIKGRLFFLETGEDIFV